jgi:hypothetical protein
MASECFQRTPFVVAHVRHCTPVSGSRGGCSFQFGRASGIRSSKLPRSRIGSIGWSKRGMSAADRTFDGLIHDGTRLEGGRSREHSAVRSLELDLAFDIRDRRSPIAAPRNSSSLLVREHLGLSGISLGLPTVEIRECLPGGVPDDVAAGHRIGSPRRWEAAGCHSGRGGRDGRGSYGLHLTGVTSNGVPFLELIQPLTVRRHGHCSVYGPPRPSVTCSAMPSSSGALSIGFHPSSRGITNFPPDVSPSQGCWGSSP